jgi:predicted GH43/DUF377 family glycosyl hydrolase
METPLDKTAARLGDGEIVKLSSHHHLFQLAAHPDNPIVRPADIGLTWFEEGTPRLGAVFNPGAGLLGDTVILTPRCHKDYRSGTFFDQRLSRERTCLEDYTSEIWPLVSEDGVNFARLGSTAIKGDGSEHEDFRYGIEDLRIVKRREDYLLVGCGKVKPPFKGENADRVAVYSTTNFTKVSYHGIIECFDSRNAVPFSVSVEDRFYMLLRFHPNTHIDCLEGGLEQLLAPANYADEWEKVYARRNETLLLEAGNSSHEREKTGPGTQVIQTDVGWLILYHAVGRIDPEIAQTYGLSEGMDRAYSVCAALLDLKNPAKVIRRTRMPVYIPSRPHELWGNEQFPVDVPAVVFPVGAIVHKDKLLVYCGAGDKYIVLLSCRLADLLEYLLNFA